MVFGIQRKRGFLELGRCGVFGGGSRLYAPTGDRPRPLRPMQMEQGRAGVLTLRRLGGAGRGAGRRAAAGRPYKNAAEHVGRGGLWPPARSGTASLLCHPERPLFVILSEAKNP